MGLAHFMAGYSATAWAQAPDTTSLFREARRAEVAYEGSIRRQAPVLFRSSRDRLCDEVVGRFCLYFDDSKDSLPAEPPEIGVERDTAIARVQRALDVAPTRSSFAVPLVRYLVQDGRATEAEAIARAYARVSSDTAGAHMLLGYALHHARNPAAAAAELDSWLRLLPPREQRRLNSLDWLLDGRERNRYRRIAEAQRAAYEARAWRFADPLYLTPGNELWTDHLARHALARMLADRPRVVNIESWGEDLEQLTVRFGAPTLTTRSWHASSTGVVSDYTEHWDPGQRMYFPPVIDSALVMQAPLDTIWPLDKMTERTGHAPPTIRMMRVLEHQAAVFEDSVARLFIHGRARVDTLVAPGSTAARLFVLDSTVSVIAEATASVSVDGDSAIFRADLTLPANASYYSAEIYDSKSRFAARARYRLVRPAPTSQLSVSSIIFAEPFEPAQLPEHHSSPLLRPLNRAVIAAGSNVGIYAEATIVAPERRNLHVEIENRRLDRPSAIGRAMGWIGQRLGLANPRSPASLGWSVEAEPNVANALPVTLNLESLEPGRYAISMKVRDTDSGTSVVAVREIMVVNAEMVSNSARP